MKQKKVLKTLADLPAELIGAEATEPEKTKLRPQVDTQQSRQIPQPIGPSKALTDDGDRHWGLNE
jgi:hypothetical protein